MSLQGFPWRYAVYFFLAIYLFADLYACRGPLHQRISAPARLSGVEGEGGVLVARVYGRGITRLELSESMRSHLWRRGEKWNELSPEAQRQTRWLVLENLVNDRIVHAFRRMNGLDHLPRESQIEAEHRMWAKQFERDEERSKRLSFQHLTEDELKARMRDDAEDQAWIEEKIAHRTKTVTEERAKEWFEANQESMAIPASYRASHVFLTRHDSKKPDRETEIREAHRRLVAGQEAFSSMAARMSEDERSKKIGGDLGWFTSDRMPPDFMAAVVKLKSGELSEPTLTKLGWHVIQLTETKPPRIPSFEEVQSEILAMLQTEMRTAAVQSLMSELRNKSMRPTQFLFYYKDAIEKAVPAEGPEMNPKPNGA